MKRIGKERKPSPLSTAETILNCMDALIYVSDVWTGEVLFINGKAKEHFRLGDDALGSICWKVFQSGQQERCDFCPLPHLLDGQENSTVWERRNTKTDRFYRNISRIIDWPDGRRVHLFYATDLTEIKLTEESMNRQLKQQELMSSISQSFTAMRDLQELIYEALKMSGEFMGVNHAFLSAYRKDEGCLECVNEWFDEEGQPFIGGESRWPLSPDMEIYKDLLENGYAAISDYSLLTHPNFQAVRNYDLRAFLNIPIEVSGEFWGIIGFVINRYIYDWSESDIHLSKLIASVFSGAISRNIVEESLYKAKVDAERASRSKGEFLSNMSHEIRTPINAIIGMTQIASNSDNPQKIEHSLGRIDSASKHLLGLVNDILDMSKIEANKIDLSPAEFELEKMLMNITNVVGFRAEEKKQSIIINIEADVPPVLIGDEMRLSQVIVNLLTNAVKFTPEGGTIALNVQNTGIADGACTLLVEVADNGIGIPADQQARLFDPFEQADTSTTRKYGGTGLGLPICKGIVELMGGGIWIESEPGRGSRFCFTVQMKLGKAARKPKLEGIAGTEDIRVLAVDDAPEIREYFLHVMPMLGLICDVADGGASALEMMEQRKDKQYNIFFLDWRMPGLNGIELAREIRRITCDNAVIIMISAADWSGIEQEATQAGIDRCISKPLFPSVLINAINESLGVATAVKTSHEDTHVNDFSAHTLLVAEDIEVNREIITAMLEDTQVSIDFAQNGLEAVALFERAADRYSLVLMDIQMPEMDGYEATQTIRALERARGGAIPIIAMTANVFREDIERCLAVGMNDHIGKPVDTGELLRKLDTYLNASASPQCRPA